MKTLSMLLTAIIFFYSSCLKAHDSKLTQVFEKTITVTLVQLQDKQGLKYIGGLVSSEYLAPYLAQMKQRITADFSAYRENQASRDHGKFHMTLINPYEYKEVDQSKVAIGDTVTITLKGLGQVTKDDKEAYFVVVESSMAQSLRHQLKLNTKDFHVTLGFKPQDVYGVSKGEERLLK